MTIYGSIRVADNIKCLGENIKIKFRTKQNELIIALQITDQNKLWLDVR